MKHINKFCAQNARFVILKQAVHKVTTGPLRVNHRDIVSNVTLFKSGTCSVMVSTIFI
jgi:hypothetical protein